MPRKIDLIVIHCSASPNGRRQTVADIDAWHRERGFKRSPEFRQRQNPELTSIGYHFVIYTNGAVATGRHLDEIGAHAAGQNSRSIGVCLIGTNQFTAEQWDSLKLNIIALQQQFPAARVTGHRDLPDVHKTCPGIDVADWIKCGMKPWPGILSISPPIPEK